MFYFVEATDTYGGEANYCWAQRFKVKAVSMRGAIIKANKELGYGRLKKVMDSGDMTRHNVVGSCICIFTTWWDENDSNYLHVKEI